MSVMVSLMVSMSSSYCSVSNRFLNSSWNSVIFERICVVSTLDGLLVIHCFQFDAVRFDDTYNHVVVTSNVESSGPGVELRTLD